jgi:hypothetical protein
MTLHYAHFLAPKLRPYYYDVRGNVRKRRPYKNTLLLRTFLNRFLADHEH